MSELADIDLTVVASLGQLSGRAAFQTRLVKRIAAWIANTSLRDIAKDLVSAVEMEEGPRAFDWYTVVTSSFAGVSS